MAEEREKPPDVPKEKDEKLDKIIELLERITELLEVLPDMIGEELTLG